MRNIYDNLLHPNETLKEKRQRILRENVKKGKAGEEIVKTKYTIDAYILEDRTKKNKGPDFHARKKDLHGNVIDDKFIDSKTGKAKLSKSQKEKGAKEERPYVPPFFYKDI